MKPAHSNHPGRSHSLKLHPFQRLLQYGRVYRPQIIWATICSILNKLFDLAPPALIGAAVDIVVQRQQSLMAQLGLTNVTHQLVALAVLAAVVWGLESVFQYAYDRLWRNLAQTIQHDLRLEAYQHLQNLELTYFEARSTGELMSVLNDDINQLERFLNGGANDILQVITTVIIIGTTFFVLAPGVAWMALLPMPAIIWGAIAFQKRLAPRYAIVRERVSFLNSRLANNLSGIITIKSFTAEAFEAQQVRTDSDAYRASNRRAIALSAAFIPLIRVLILLAFMAILLFGGLEVMAGRLAVGTYSVLVFLTQRLLWPLTRLGDTLDQYQRAMASTQRVMTLLDTPIRIHPGHRHLPTSVVQGGVEFQGVSFAYDQGFPVLQDVSIAVPTGQTIAIVGPTGSGKSTLVKLLLRLYEMDRGQITLDGIPIETLQLQDLRQAIGLVSQDVFLFHGTVYENIAYGQPHTSRTAVEAAAQNAEAHGFITQLPQGYDTIVGERGQKLSGGQRQRLAIARTLLKDPPVLVLDEATSAVDNETEAAIQRSLDRVTVNRTTIAIAHRLSTIRHADCIYVLAQGQVMEQGQHDQLLAQEGIYAQLWRVQTGQRMQAPTR